MKIGLLITLALALGASFVHAAEPAVKDKFVVHEWGVAIVDGNGGALGPAKEFVDDLPAFVLRHDKTYSAKRQDQGWDKPVIHLYGPEGLTVELEVQTPQGRPIAYWPKPALMERVGKPVVDRQAKMVYTLTEAHGMRWEGTLSKAPTNEPATVASTHWWGRLRDGVPSMYFNTPAGASERFLFYEATATQAPFVKAIVTSDTITLSNVHDKPNGPVMILTNDGKSRHGARVGSVGPKGEVTLSRAGMTEVSWDDRETLGAFESLWRAAGLTQAEAKAITDVWRDDLLNRPGFFMISRMPAEAYEQMFPLKVTPQPDERVRAGMVIDTLVGQPDREKWLVNLDIMMPEWGRQLGAEDFKQRKTAARKFAALGELAVPFLRELAKDSDPEVAKAAATLLRSSEPARSAEQKTN